MSKKLSIQKIQSSILTLPNRAPFMLAQNLAVFYQTQVKRINQVVSRNEERFPEDFCFQLSNKEVEYLRSQNESTISKMARVNPYGFTREGANMLSALLQSEIAIERSVQIMRAFSALERELLPNFSGSLIKTVNEMLKKVEQALEETRELGREVLKITQEGNSTNKRVSILENQIEAVMKTKGSFNEKHWLFGKFVEVMAEGLDQNREEIVRLKTKVDELTQQQFSDSKKNSKKPLKLRKNKEVKSVE